MTEPPTLFWIIFAVIAFAAGSLPFGVIMARMKGIDLRSVGSGNVGATNVGRALGRGAGFTCLVLDMAKGAAPVLVAGSMGHTLGVAPNDASLSSSIGWLAVGLAAILGHVYSPFLRFKGGKGVATAAGALGAMWPTMSLPVIAAMVVFAIVRLTSGITSIASLCAAWTLPIAAFSFGFFAEGGSVFTGVPACTLGMLIALLVTWRHRENITRLRAGTEPRTAERAGQIDPVTKQEQVESRNSPERH